MTYCYVVVQIVNSFHPNIKGLCKNSLKIYPKGDDTKKTAWVCL